MSDQVSLRISAVGSKRGTEKTYCLLLAGVGFAAVGIQCYMAVRANTGTGVPTAIAVVNVLSYFTILTNILAALTLLAAAMGTPRRLTSPQTQTAVCSYILVVGFVYETVLRKLWKPEGLHFAVDTTLHDIVPIGFLIYWLLFVPKEALTYRSIPRWTIYPATYALYCLLRGLLHGFFPYAFIDFRQNGWSLWALNVIVLVALFVGMGAAMIAIGRMLERRRVRAVVR